MNPRWLILSILIVSANAAETGTGDYIQFLDGRKEYGKVEYKNSFPAVYKLLVNGSTEIRIRDVDLFSSSGKKYGIYHTGALLNDQLAEYKSSCGIDYYVTQGFEFNGFTSTETGLAPVTRGRAWAEYYSYRNSGLKKFELENYVDDFQFIPQTKAHIDKYRLYRNIKWAAFAGGVAVLLIGGATDNLPTQRTGLAISASALIPWGLQTWEKWRVRPSIEKYFKGNGCSNE